MSLIEMELLKTPQSPWIVSLISQHNTTLFFFHSYVCVCVFSLIQIKKPEADKKKNPMPPHPNIFYPKIGYMQ